MDFDAPPRLIGSRARRCRMSVGSARIGGRPSAVPWGSGPRDQLVIVEAVTERPLAELRCAVVDKPTWTLNGVAPMRFKVSAEDTTLLDCMVDPDTIVDGAGELRLLGYVEAQFWRDGELRWAGPIVAADVDLSSGVVEFECWDLGWYLTRRFMGEAERRDLLNGLGSMDVYGLPGWTRDGVTAVRNTTTKVRGVGAAQIAGTGTLTAGFPMPAQSNNQDLTVLLSLMVRIPVGTPVGTAIATIQAYPSGSSDAYLSGAANTFTTDSQTPLGRWTRITAKTSLKADVVNNVAVILWSAGYGNTYVDDCRALRNDTTGSEGVVDLGLHGTSIMKHVNGKGSLGFQWKRLAPSGTAERLAIRHLEHSQILDLFDQYVNRSDGWDWWVDPWSRTVFFAPARGQVQTGVALDDRSVLAGGWSHDESDKASAVVVLGDADGIDRPEGSYVNTSRTGGLLFEHLEPSKNGRTLQALDPTARSLWDEKSQPQTVLGPVIVPASWWTDHDLSPGDVFPNYLRNGVLRPATGPDGFRVQEITHDLVSDTLELV